MYEIGDYIYTFFREEAIEKPLPEDRVSHSLSCSLYYRESMSATKLHEGALN